jgi:sialidase-1
MRAAAFATLIALSAGAAATAEADDDAAVSATTSQPAHPALIRNPQNAVAKVVVEVRGGDGVRLRSAAFSLDGTDDVAGVESWQLFAGGERQEFSPEGEFGAPSPSARALVFRGERVLRPGPNVFWLSCRLRPAADLTHHVAAVCTAIETSAGKITRQTVPQDLSPGFRQRIGVALRRHMDDGVHTYRIPALATTRDGTLLAVYDVRRRASRDLQGDIDIGLSRSADGGRSWEPMRIIMDMGEHGGRPQEENGCSDPGIIVDRQTGEVFCFAVWMHGKPGKHQWRGDGSEPGFEIEKSAQLLMVRSRDDGRTWSAPENLTRRLKKEAWWLFAPAPQQGIQLGDGTLVMPAQGRDEKGEKFSTLMVSRDHGENWTAGAPAYLGGSECQAVDLGGGAILLNIRNDRERFRAVFMTRDLGETWEPHATNRNTLIEPTCNASLLRVDVVEAGERRPLLLFSNPHSQVARTHQSVQVSFDGGRTWPASHRWLLDEGRGNGYSSLTRVDEEHVAIVYEGSQAQLVFEKLPIAELLDPARRAGRPALEVRDGPERIEIRTAALEASVRKRGYVSGVEAGSLRDLRSGAREQGFGLDIVDWIMEPGSDAAYRAALEGDLPYDFDNVYHGKIPKRSIEGPQICTKAGELSPVAFRGPDFIAIQQSYRYRIAAPGKKAGSLWEQTLVFPAGKRYFVSRDRVTTLNASEAMFFRLDMPGHVKHKGGDAFSEIYLSYHGRIPAGEFAADFAPDERFLYQRAAYEKAHGGPPRRFIRAYRIRDPATGREGPWLAGMTLDPRAVHEAWCHQRGYVCFIEEIGGRPVKPGDAFGAAFIVGYFDSIEQMEQVYDQHAGKNGLEASEAGWRLTERP